MLELKNILSIDFDKFLSKELEIKSEIQNKLLEYNNWLRNYLNNKKYFDITIKHNELAKIISLIFKTTDNIPLLVADSHARIISMLSDITKDLNNENIKYNIYNVDHHHDICYNDKFATTKFNCSNWISHLQNLNKLNEYTWICNDNSDEYNSSYPIRGFNLTSDMSILDEIKFDAIFICKSSSWVPLHLHSEFNKFINILSLRLNPIFTNENYINPLLNFNNFDSDNIKEIISLYEALGN